MEVVVKEVDVVFPLMVLDRALLKKTIRKLDNELKNTTRVEYLIPVYNVNIPFMERIRDKSETWSTSRHHAFLLREYLVKHLKRETPMVVVKYETLGLLKPQMAVVKCKPMKPWLLLVVKLKRSIAHSVTRWQDRKKP